jgi:flagellar export protein FliJ
MKKFKFPLQKVLDYDTHMQNREMDKLSSMRNKCAELEKEKLYLVRQYEQTKSKYLKSCEEGISIKKAAALRLYMEEQKEQIEVLNARIEEQKRLIEQQLEILLEVTKDKMTIEKLKEGSLLQYNAVRSKHEEVLIDEFIANKSIRVAE